MSVLRLTSLAQDLGTKPTLRSSGKVLAVRGPIILARIPQVAIGDLCYVSLRDGKQICAQVVSFEEDTVNLAPLDEMEGLSPGATVIGSGSTPKLGISESMIGHVLDPLGAFLDTQYSNAETKSIPETQIIQAPPAALKRLPVDKILETGVKSIDCLCTLGRGQRVGLFASAGGGKSTLLGMLARNTEADLNVIALVGERGREVNDFIEESLGESGLKKSIVVVSTSDEPPLRRFMAALTATAIADYFRSRGKNVLLLIDSLTRVARAVRDVSLAAGELPVRQGYTPSVYMQLPRLLERAGTSDKGSISAIYTVLTNGEGEVDPLGEEIKSLLDGHIVLDSNIARQGIRPAIDPLTSVSRLMSQLHPNEYIQKTELIRSLLARLKKDKDILLFGGTPDAELKAAMELEENLKRLLNQRPHERADTQLAMSHMCEIAEKFAANRRANC